ncbi:hypothetical protein INT47_012962 [Mucor saturninus]|uniref:SWIM-type domain-containing protein n=1 Tax=Mucor saturninus TaxID=64648 RepID=A0A8H7V0Y7_9FUNG|nr:hypothetical protein INT47_012962 [Mucor saturninus]
MTEMTEEMLNETELLIQALLSEYNDKENINDGLEETFANVSKEEREDAPVKTGLTDEFDWNTVSNVEEEEVEDDEEGSYGTDFPVPSFEDTVGSSEAVVGMKEAFEKEFPTKKTFADKNSARAEMQEFCKAQNIPFETLRSDKVYIKLVCKNFGDYSSTRGVEKDGNDDEGGFKRPNRKTGKVGCTAFIHPKMDLKDVEKRWFVSKTCLEHTHPVSNNRKMYHVNRKLEADDQESAIKMMQSGSTPSAVLELLRTRDVCNVTVTDLTNIQQRFCRDDSIFVWDFIKRLETTNHHTNSHKMVLLNFVVAGALRSKEKPKQLTTVPIAGCWMDKETTERYQWALQCFRDIVWPISTNENLLPKCFVTDNEEALLEDIKSVFPNNPGMQLEVRSFLKIVQKMAFVCSTLEQFKAAKAEYDALVSRPGLCTKDGAIIMRKYLEFMMKKARFWAGYHDNSLMHMGNRTSNRVEATHTNIKRHAHTSSGSISVVTDKINAWTQKREGYRDLQSTREALSQQTMLLNSDIMAKISLIKMNVTSFALENIKLGLLEMRLASEDQNHKSPVVHGEKPCLCSLRRNYNLPCRHSLAKLLFKNNGVIPLKAISKRWRIYYVKGSVAIIAEIKQDKPEPTVCSDDPKSPQSRLMLRLERFSLLLKTVSSQQEPEDVLKRIDALYDELVDQPVAVIKGIDTIDSNPGLLQQLHPLDAAQTLALVNPQGDGNCEFRAVSLALFGHVEGWVQVKKSMLSTLLSYRNVYAAIELDIKYFETKLNTNKSPCLDSTDYFMWFDTVGCPQLVTDTFKRPVVLLSSSPKIFKETGIEYDNKGLLYSAFD